jgi:ribulose-5-phosphate 4-epimerase/fuculose-1-phosphate aldolase
VILTQGHGTVNGMTVSTPSMIRFGAMTEDEFFVTAAAAEKGVVIENKSSSDPLVLLKHFGPGNPDAASLVKK